jgi:RNA polymerase sigma-70 factor (ECF subfamily)
MPLDDLTDHRAYLLLLARQQVGPADRLNPSDLVQQTLLDAFRQRDQFRGTTPAELAAWLRRILAGHLADARRRLHTDKRDVARERSLDAALEASSARLEAFLAADQSSPSERAERHEQAARLLAALDHLPEDQRRAVTLRHLEGQTLNAISRILGRSPQAVAGLLKRGLRALRELLHDSRPDAGR